MRAIAFVGFITVLATAGATAPAAAESASPGGRWSSVPTLALNAAGATAERRAGGWGMNGWRGGGNWNPGGHNVRVQRFSRGFVLPSYWMGPNNYINDWAGYGLRAPGNGQRWVRANDGAYLVDDRGMIQDEPYWIDWEAYEDGPVPNYAGRDERADDYYGDDMVTWRDRSYGGPTGAYMPGPGYPMQAGNGNVIYVPPGGAVVVTVNSAPVTTTKTYYTTEYVRAKPRKTAWKAGPRLVKARPKCQCKG